MPTYGGGYGGSEDTGGYNTPNYQEQGGETLIIGSDITITGTIDATSATVNLPADVVTTADIADGAVTSEKLALDAVETINIADGAILANKIYEDQIVTTKLADSTVTFTKTYAFLSSILTGTGSEQTIAHGLGVVPDAVMIIPYDTAPATTGDYTCTEGTHTSTDIVVTVTSGKKFKAFAWA